MTDRKREHVVCLFSDLTALAEDKLIAHHTESFHIIFVFPISFLLNQFRIRLILRGFVKIMPKLIEQKLQYYSKIWKEEIIPFHL